MPDLPQRIRNNLERVRQQIVAAAVAAGRDPAEVELVAVSKYVGVEETAALLAAGCRQVAESRPQQLWDKAAAPQLRDARWHLVGHLQRNKIRRTLPLVQLIHSVDSERLLQAIEHEAQLQQLRPALLLEVNCSGEKAKHGFDPAELAGVVERCGRLSAVRIEGLMTMAAQAGEKGVARRNFANLRELRDQVEENCPPSVSLASLSMGMSDDFEAAIMEGATLVRIGSRLWEGVV
jgi:pyridoxal phosphate enzyme (YggS family)